MKTEHTDKHEKQAEGYHLMWYRCDKCQHIERLWNSRNAVTPFMIGCQKCDGHMKHIQWENDEYAPHFKPKKGMRIFVNMTKERARQLSEKYIDTRWDQKLADYPTMAESGHWATKQDAVDYFANTFYSEFGEGTTPDVITVEADWK